MYERASNQASPALTAVRSCPKLQLNVHSVHRPSEGLSTTSTSKNAAVREERRATILDAALELFAERGFHATNVPLVAGQAGMSVGTLYHYFASKEQIVNELYRKLRREMGAALWTDFPASAPSPEVFRVWWQRAAAYAQANPLAFSFLEHHHHAPYLDQENRALLTEALAAEGRLFEQGRQAGVLKPLPDAVLSAFVGGALKDLVKAAQQGRVELTPDLIDQASACCWEAIRAHH
jgi:TetR/AcrR family transcriptional regulator, repressor of fatR-cypB operon